MIIPQGATFDLYMCDEHVVSATALRDIDFDIVHAEVKEKEMQPLMVDIIGHLVDNSYILVIDARQQYTIGMSYDDAFNIRFDCSKNFEE